MPATKEEKFKDLIRQKWGEKEVSLRAFAEECKTGMDDPDWPWSGFIVSFATFGGSANWDERIKARRHEFSWAAVDAMNQHQRQAKAIDLANPRRRFIVEPAFESCYQRFREAGGPNGIRRQINEKANGPALLKYLQTFKGIGEKYSRNMMMDVYHPLMRNCFASDSRLINIMEAAHGLRYGISQCEKQLQRIAQGIEMECWFLDRLLYWNHDWFIGELAG